MDINVNPIQIADDLANGEADSPAALRARNAILEARIKELEAELKAAQDTIADLRDLAYNRAPKIAAEEANRQKAELEKARDLRCIYCQVAHEEDAASLRPEQSTESEGE